MQSWRNESESDLEAAKLLEEQNVQMSATVSQMKKGKKKAFFDAKITGGCKNMRVVGFQHGHHKKNLKGSC